MSGQRPALPLVVAGERGHDDFVLVDWIPLDSTGVDRDAVQRHVAIPFSN